MNTNSNVEEKEIKQECITKDEIFTRLKSLIAEIVNIDENNITYKTRYVEDLMVDSIDMMNLIYAMEEEFQKSISEDELTNIKVVENTIDFIHSKLST